MAAAVNDVVTIVLAAAVTAMVVFVLVAVPMAAA